MEGTHRPIIDRETHRVVQTLLEKQGSVFYPDCKATLHPFSKKTICEKV